MESYVLIVSFCESFFGFNEKVEEFELIFLDFFWFCRMPELSDTICDCEVSENRGMYKFHDHHGENIVLSPDETVAFRKAGYSGGLAFSAKPLSEGQLFLVEIEGCESGWSGNLRLGVTQADPHLRSPLPDATVPRLALSPGASWVYSVDGCNGLRHTRNSECCNRRNCSRLREYLARNRLDFEMLLPRDGELLPAEVGSRLGLILIPDGDERADLFFFINGVPHGPMATGIPYKKAPLYVVVDVYGATRRVRILQRDKGTTNSNRRLSM